MNIIKGFKDLGAMATAAPGLIESANEMAATAKAMQGASVPVTASQPAAEHLAPIAGVDLDTYVRVSKGIAAYGYDAAMLPAVAATLGVSASDWSLAQAGWAQRIQTDAGIGARFNQLYLAA
jgi:hypothetical protein